MTLKVSIIEPVGGHGGMNYYDFGLASGLALAGVSTSLYTCDQTAPPSQKDFEFNTPFRNIYGNKSKIIRAINFARAHIKALWLSKKSKASVIHLHTFHSGALELFSALSAKTFGFKVAITIHDVESFSGTSSTAVSRLIFSLADALIAHNKVSAAELISISAPKEKIHIIPHGNYLNFSKNPPSKECARKKLGIPDTEDLILFFGQIKAVKGLDILLHAMPDLLKERPHAKLLIAGKVWKDDFEQYEKIIETHGISKNIIRHIRYIPDSEVLNYYSACDIVALPYRKIYQSGVLLMAMSFAKPVITSNIKGMTEVISSEDLGYTFESESIHSLSAQLHKALTDKKVSAQKANLGLELMSSDYSWEKIGKSTADLFHSIS